METADTANPGACCLIEGKMSNIMPFLDSLTYGDRTPEEVEATREEWRRKWRNNGWRTRMQEMIARDRDTGKSGV